MGLLNCVALETRHQTSGDSGILSRTRHGPKDGLGGGYVRLPSGPCAIPKEQVRAPGVRLRNGLRQSWTVTKTVTTKGKGTKLGDTHTP